MSMRDRSDSVWSQDDYCLDRLFDPEELYYTPMDILIKRYKIRNLRFYFKYFKLLIRKK